MKARPIPFSGPMIRALIDGSKTKTRRMFKYPKWSDESAGIEFSGINGGPAVLSIESGCFADVPCPYGVPGDLLWVREAWRVANRYDSKRPRDIPVRACTLFYEIGGSRANYEEDGELRWGDEPNGWPARREDRPLWVGRYRSARFMPRWASRITLRITDVRVERLQEISKADAIAEGIHGENVITGCNCDGGVHQEETAWRYSYDGCGEGDFEHAQDAYAALWDSINGKGAWETNPWVWVVLFTVIKQNVDVVLGAAT